MGAAEGLNDRYLPMIEADGERARSELRSVVAREPASAPAWGLLAKAYLRCLDLDAAMAAGRRLLELEPNSTYGLHMLGQCQLVKNDLEGALASYERAHRATRSVQSANHQGVVLHRLGRLAEAERRYRSVVSGANMDALEMNWALRGLVGVLRDAGRPLEADRYAHQLLARISRDPVRYASQLVNRDQSNARIEWFELADKANLARLLQRGGETAGLRAPESFVLPEDRAALVAFAAGAPKGAVWIVKPVRGTGGQGISLAADLSAVLDLRDVVVQRYIADPYLVDGRKGHLRIYLLFAALEPLRAYVYGDGVVRFAPEPYDLRPERLGEVSMHVTNTALHRGHPGLVISQDPARDGEGSIWSLAAYLRRLQADGCDPQRVRGDIHALVAAFVRLLRADGLFARLSGSEPPHATGPKLIGLDVLLDAAARPWLIECQAKPAMSGAPLVERVNGPMFATMARMTTGCLFDDAMSAEEVAALRREPAARATREHAIELTERGLFEPLAAD